MTHVPCAMWTRQNLAMLGACLFFEPYWNWIGSSFHRRWLTHRKQGLSFVIAGGGVFSRPSTLQLPPAKLLHKAPRLHPFDKFWVKEDLVWLRVEQKPTKRHGEEEKSKLSALSLRQKQTHINERAAAFVHTQFSSLTLTTSPFIRPCRWFKHIFLLVT